MLRVDNGNFEYKGRRYGSQDAACRIRVFDRADRNCNGRDLVVVMTQLDKYEGLSVTNGCEFIASKIVQTPFFEGANCTFVEHYPAYNEMARRLFNKPSFSVVSFAWRDGKASNPAWQYITQADLERMIGEPFVDETERDRALPVEPTRGRSKLFKS
jgi:hypothetical protein